MTYKAHKAYSGNAYGKHEKLIRPRPVEAVSEAPLSNGESALLLGALLALAVSLASFTTL